MGPRHNRIHLGLGNYPKLQWQHHSNAKSPFIRDYFYLPKRPRAKVLTRDPKIRSRAQQIVPGHEKTKDAR